MSYIKLVFFSIIQCSSYIVVFIHYRYFVLMFFIISINYLKNELSIFCLFLLLIIRLIERPMEFCVDQQKTYLQRVYLQKSILAKSIEKVG